MPRAEELKIIYKEKVETRASSRNRLCEGVYAFSMATAEASGRQPAVVCGPRLHFTLTSTASDCILMASEPSESSSKTFPKDVKQATLGPNGILPQERAANDPVVLFHHEKTVQLYEEIFHHFNLSSLILLSGGAGNAVVAAMRLGIKALTFAKNNSHKDTIRTRLLEYMVEASHHAHVVDLPGSPANPLFLARATLLADLSLEADPAADPVADTAADTAADTSGDRESLDGEEEADGEEADGEEEEEEEGE
jgi:hypothetical protein